MEELKSAECAVWTPFLTEVLAVDFPLPGKARKETSGGGAGEADSEGREGSRKGEVFKEGGGGG